MVVVLVLVVVVVVVVGGGGDFRRSKSAPQRLYKQKQSTDKQSVIKPHFTRHAGKAGGLYLYISNFRYTI